MLCTQEEVDIRQKVQNTQDTELKEAKNPKDPVTLGRAKKPITGVQRALGRNEIGRGRGIT